MASIKPFKALRPQQHLADQVAARPYDVLNSDEAREEAQGNPFSFLHLLSKVTEGIDSTTLQTQILIPNMVFGPAQQ